MSEKFPWLFERRFGIRAFDYRFGYTAAQIELMVMDQPTITYDHKDKKRGSMMATKREVEEMDELTRAWKARHGESRVGKEFSLEGFLKGDGV